MAPYTVSGSSASAWRARYHAKATQKSRVQEDLASDLPGVDARPWLLELSYDENPKVRAAAVTLMATSGDLEMLRRVRQVSLDDPDDYTRAQAEKALPKQRR